MINNPTESELQIRDFVSWEGQTLCSGEPGISLPKFWNGLPEKHTAQCDRDFL